MSVNLAGVLGPSFMVVWIVVAALTVVVHVIFAVAIYRDATRVYATRGATELVDPVLWTVATLLGGVVVAGFYWVVHHMPLRPAPDRAPTT